MVHYFDHLDHHDWVCDTTGWDQRVYYIRRLQEMEIGRASCRERDWSSDVCSSDLVGIIIYLLGGAFMDALGFLVISIPLFFPLLSALGYDIVWFTILITLITTIGSVTPPVGINVFITSGVPKKW